MKILFTVLFSILVLGDRDRLVNSVWTHKIADGCNNKLTFKPNGLVLEYDCEMDYAFHSKYELDKDTLLIKGKDDSHSEDNGKVTSYWMTKYLIKNSGLYAIDSKELVNGKWKDRKIKVDKNPDYRRIK